jgi:hypothetical protein
MSKDLITRRDLIARLLAVGLSFQGSRALAQGLGLLPGTLTEPGTRAPWDESFEVAITFQVGDPRSAFTRRPYVAVFIEDAEGKPVRTVSLWALRTVSWLRGLRHWYRAEVARAAAAGGGTLVQTLTSPTRNAGRYTVVWDGRDNARNYVERGRYFVCIESVRQGGGNHLVRKEFTFDSTPFEAEIEPLADLSEMKIEYRKRG